MSEFENEISSMKCPKCGSANEGNMKFCGNCGEKLLNTPISTEPINAEPINAKPINVEPIQTVDAEVVESTPLAEQEISINYNSVDTSNNYQNNSNIPPIYEAVPQAVNVNGMIGISIASMVCGILSLLCCCISGFVFVLSIAAIVLGIISIKNTYEGKAMAIAGIVTGTISIIFWGFFFLIVGTVSMAEIFSSIM